MLKAENICRTFDGKTVLDNVSLCVESGEITGLFGDSGIGKSTLAKILCGAAPADSGRVFLQDKLVLDASGKYDRKSGLKIQMVYQQPYASLDPKQRVYAALRELIRYHALAPRSEEAELIENTAAAVGLRKDILAHLPRQLSGGEAQRAAIAKCLLLRPEIMIMDEATSMLDVSTQANILALVRREICEKGGGVLLISHDRELVNCVCTKIYEFSGSKVKEKK